MKKPVKKNNLKKTPAKKNTSTPKKASKSPSKPAKKEIKKKVAPVKQSNPPIKSAIKKQTVQPKSKQNAPVNNKPEKTKKNSPAPAPKKSVPEKKSSPQQSPVANNAVVRPLTEKPIHDKKGNLIAPEAPVKIFKLRIDGRTIISVKSKEALRIWKERYPSAVEVD
jgi:hypothetical protein